MLRDLIVMITLGVTIYLYITRVDFANLLAITFFLGITFKLANYFALKDSIRNILKDEQLAIKLWDREIMAIRYHKGSVIFKTKKIN